MVEQQLDSEDKDTLLILLKTEKDRIIDRMELTEDPDKIEDLENKLNLTNKTINCISNEKTITGNLINHIRNILFFKATRVIHNDGNEDVEDYYSIAESLGVKDELDDLLKIFDKRVGLHS